MPADSTTAGTGTGTASGATDTTGGTATPGTTTTMVDTDGDGVPDTEVTTTTTMVDTDGDGVPDTEVTTTDDGTGDDTTTDDGTMEDVDIEPSAEIASCTGVPATSQVPRILNHQYDNIVKDLLGVTTLGGGELPSSRLNTDFGGPIDTFTWNAYKDVGAAIASEVIAGPNKANFISCDPAADAACWENTIKTFGRKAFRRPLEDAEVQSFMSLTTIEPAGTADEIAEAILYTFLISPSFIMVPEMSATAEGPGFALSSHEVATRLALTLWGSVGDDELNAAADADGLQTKEEILDQAKRMLGNRDKVAPQVVEAHRHYLVMDDLSHWYKISHDSAEFPNYSDDLRGAYRAEMDAFFEEMAYNGGSFGDLFTSTVGFVNQDTAALYGLNPADYGAEMTKVDLPDRPGFLTRVGFLSSFASPSVTSPILRGAFITVNVLGVDPGAPDPAFAQTPIPMGDYSTRREQMDALTEPAECSGCHQGIVNPPGYVLENFNAVGEWQDVDPLGGAIDPAATVQFGGDKGSMDIANAAQMMQEIATVENAQNIYAERLVAYATGRLPNDDDACIVGVAASKLAGGGYTILDLFADLTQADSFRLRTVEAN
jgi:hypothetical protein